MRWPDLTFLIDITAEEAIKRQGRDGSNPQFFEKLKKLDRVRKHYDILMDRKDLGPVIRINGQRGAESVFHSITDHLTRTGVY